MFSVFLISIFGLRLLAQTRNDIIPLNEFHYTNLFNMTSATEKFQLTPAPTLSGLNKLKHFLALSLLITFSFNAFSADNLPQLNKEEFNKEAYLDLSKPYTYNWNNPQGYTKKDN
ncbi:hypothetical protein BSPLISOX_531 [uncultured Gammaproteobacteria bacterium]|jgi:hypothetical protein|nr:hypothetical protein [uncultured Gammaproteobacteria bacterium]VVH66354.1 hypothetical protein BSPLISOX_531 [uncultured Gammaproteobacteria bacterium]